MAKYGLVSLESVVEGSFANKRSQWWRDTLNCCEVFENGLGWFQNNVLIDGSEVDFWRAKWIGEKSLCTKFNCTF